MKTNLFVEDYRPSEVDDCVLPDRIKKLAKDIVASGEIPNMILSGGPGCGKTTLAKAIAAELGVDVLVINGSDERNIDTLRTKVKSHATVMGSGVGSMLDDDAPRSRQRLVIFDEADHLNQTSTQPALRNFIEEYSGNCRFIFTCNHPSMIIEPLHSRCTSIDFSFDADEEKQMIGEFAKRLVSILDENEIKYDVKTLVMFTKSAFPDFRRILNEVQSYARSNGSIDQGLLKSVASVKIDEVIKAMADKDFSAIRTFFGENRSLATKSIYTDLWHRLTPALQPTSIPQAVMVIGDWQAKSALVADQEINVVACCVDLMTNCEFK